MAKKSLMEELLGCVTFMPSGTATMQESLLEQEAYAIMTKTHRDRLEALRHEQNQHVDAALN